MADAGTAYLEAQVETATPERLHLMIVDAAIRFARSGSAAIERQDWFSVTDRLGRSRDCVSELISAINPEINPDLAVQLKSLFLFVHAQLTLADLAHDPAPIEDAIRILTLHRETWCELLEKLSKEKSTRNLHSSITENTDSTRNWVS